MPAGVRGWTRRMAILPPAARSLEAIREAQTTSGTSLGMFRPRKILRLTKRPAKPWSEKQRAYLQRQHLDLGAATSRELSELEQIPWSFSYEFLCDDVGCTTPHSLSIIDWEIGAAYRNWTRTYGNDWEAKLREKFEQQLPATDLHLVVGNLAAHHGSFVIVGLVRPPRMKVYGGYVQETLDLMRQERSMAGVGVGLEAEEADALGLEERHQTLELFPDEG